MVKKGRSAPVTETEEMPTKLKVRKVRNSRRKGWEMRRMKLADDGETKKSCVGVMEDEAVVEISLSFPSSCSSSDNDTAVSEKSDAVGDERGEKRDETVTKSHGFVSIIGRRREMEDAVTVRTGFMDEYCDDVKNGESYDFFGVYDGHGGSDVSHFCQEKLHQVVANEVREYMFGGGGQGQRELVNWEKVMAGSFWKMDEQIGNAEAQESMKTIGSTAVVAVVGKGQLIVANCGDSRAVVCRSGVAVPLSTDHKPDRPDELERVEAAGGRIINWNGFRVLGVLATSRSIGDQYLKPFVTSDPEVTVCQRTKNDEFLILASDGLWDVISNQVACQVVRKFLYSRLRKEKQDVIAKENNATRAAALLAELAMARGSNDNISVIVVDLKKSR